MTTWPSDPQVSHSGERHEDCPACCPDNVHTPGANVGPGSADRLEQRAAAREDARYAAERPIYYDDDPRRCPPPRLAATGSYLHALVTVTSDVEHAPIHVGERRTFNAGIRASEAIVRGAARIAGTMFEGDRPRRDGDVYTRVWVAQDRSDVLRVTVRKVRGEGTRRDGY